MTDPPVNIDHVPYELQEAAKRAHGIVQTLYAYRDWWNDLRWKWIAINLGTGDWDGTLYDNKRDAVKHQAREQHCAYIALRGLGPSGSSVHGMAIFLLHNRNLYRRGYRLPDPDDKYGGLDSPITAARNDFLKNVLDSGALGR